MNERRSGRTWRGRPPGPDPKRLDPNRPEAPPPEAWPEIPELAPPPPPPEPPWPLPEEKPVDLEEELGDVRDNMRAIQAAREAEAKAKDEAARRARDARLPFLPAWVPQQIAHVTTALAAMEKANVAPVRRPCAGPPPVDPDERLRAWGVPKGVGGVTWDTLATLTKKGRLSLGEVETKNGRRLLGESAVAAIRQCLQEHDIVVFQGEMRSGKSLVLVAALQDDVRAGKAGVRFVDAEALREIQTIDETIARMWAADTLYWDDAGWECGRHQPDSAWSRNAALPARRFLARWVQNGSPRRLRVTTNFDGAGLAARYGPEAAARLLEHAEVIRFFRRSEDDDPVLRALTDGDD